MVEPEDGVEGCYSGIAHMTAATTDKDMVVSMDGSLKRAGGYTVAILRLGKVEVGHLTGCGTLEYPKSLSCQRMLERRGNTAEPGKELIYHVRLVLSGELAASLSELVGGQRIGLVRREHILRPLLERDEGLVEDLGQAKVPVE